MIELNPGPQQGVNCQTTLSVGSTMLLSFRLRQLGLRPLDIVQVTVFSELFHISYLVIEVITGILDKLVFII